MSRKLALVIGNSEYHDPGLAQLKSPGLDAYDLAGALRAPEIGAFDEVATLINETEAAVRRAIARFFVNRKPDDLLLLYFSGHGVRDDQGQLHLAVKDTDRALLSATAIPAAFVTGQMDLSRSRRQVLILDCCNSGAFDRAAKSGGAGSSMGTATAFEGLGYGRVVLTASDSTQYAWEGDDVVGEAANSVFTRYLVQGLETGEADIDNDGLIALDEWYDYVYAHVVGETPKQTPGKWSYKQQGDLIIAKNPRPRAPGPVALPQEVRQALESPLAYVREGAARELGRLLHGSEAGLAAAAHEALKRLIEDDSRRVSTAARESLNAEAEAQRAQEREREARERLAAQQMEEARLAREAKRAEEERLARERAETERIAKQRADDERLARERAEQERFAQIKAEQDRLVAAQAEAERAARQKAEEERLTRERAEQERLAQIRAEQERLAQAEADRVAREQAERERLEGQSSGAAQMASAAVAVQPPEPVRAAAQRHGVAEWMARPWFPLAALCLGWGLAFFSGTTVFWFLYQTGQDFGASRFGELMLLGLIGGSATWLNLRASPARGGAPPFMLVTGLWVAITLLGMWLNPYLQEVGVGRDESVAWERAIFGALGGVGIGAVLYWKRWVDAQRALIIATGWAIGWSVAAWLGLMIYDLFGDDPGFGLKEALKSIGLMKEIVEALVPWVDALIRGLSGALAGLISGWVMFTQLGPAASVEKEVTAGSAPVEESFPAYGIAWLIITIGWVAASLVIPPLANFAFSEATYGVGAPLASAACAGLTVLALRRLLSPLPWPVMASLALGWGLTSIYAEALTTHFFRGLLGWSWELSALAATLLDYAVGGGMLACLLWGLRVQGRRLPALGLALGFAGAFYLTDLFMRQAVYSSGLYYSIQEGAHNWLGDNAVLLSNAIAGGIGGGVAGALCGGVLLGVLYWARRLRDTSINSHLLRLEEFFTAATRPLVIITLGWIIARAVEAGLFYFITRDGYSFDGLALTVVATWVLSGAIGGLGLWRALSSWEARYQGLHWKLVGTWAVAWAVGAAIHLLFIFLIDEFGWPLQVGVTFALASLFVGVIGGSVTARLIRGAGGEQTHWTTIGWALAWMLAALASSYSATEQGWWFGGLLEGLVGGWLGGAVMLWQLDAAHASSEI
jgi:hypothetical protein